jgi:hypothetical protein
VRKGAYPGISLAAGGTIALARTSKGVTDIGQGEGIVRRRLRIGWGLLVVLAAGVLAFSASASADPRPTANIASPESGGFYEQGENVPAEIECHEFGEGFSPLESCSDSNGFEETFRKESGTSGFSAGGLPLNTSEPGPHEFSVTAKSYDGQTGTASITYSVYGTLSPSNTNCSGDYGGSGKQVTVLKGQTCILLAGTKVSGNVSVMPAGSLIDEGATIGGNLTATSPRGIQVEASSVIGHELEIKGMTGSNEGATNFICGASIGGSLSFLNTAARPEMVIGGESDHKITSDRPAEVGDEPEQCPGNEIGHNLTVENNADDVAVSGNTVGASLLAEANHDRLTVSGNTITEDMTVSLNSGGASVVSNSVGQRASCQHNKPNTTGAGNTAPKNEGCPAQPAP